MKLVIDTNPGLILKYVGSNEGICIQSGETCNAFNTYSSVGFKRSDSKLAPSPAFGANSNENLRRSTKLGRYDIRTIIFKPKANCYSTSLVDNKLFLLLTTSTLPCPLRFRSLRLSIGFWTLYCRRLKFSLR